MRPRLRRCLGGNNGVAGVDTDRDGTADCIDECDNDINKTVPGQCGCGNPETDTDNDNTLLY